jgi:hypothetical protein
VLSRSVSESLLEMENFDDPMLSPTGNNYRGGNCAVCSSPEYLASFCHCTSSIAAGKRMIPFDELQELEEDGSTRQRLGTGTFLNAELLDDCISLDDADLPDCHGGSIRKAAMAAVAKFAPRPLSDDSGNESAKSTSSRETIGNDYCLYQMIKIK